MRLGTKINLVLATVTIVVLTIAFWVIVSIEAASIKKDVLNNSEATAGLLRDDIERILRQTNDQEIRLQATLDALSKTKHTKYISVLNPEGYALISTDPMLIGKRIIPEKLETLRRVIVDGKPVEMRTTEDGLDIVSMLTPTYYSTDNRTSLDVSGVIDVGINTNKGTKDNVLSLQTLLGEISADVEQSAGSLMIMRRESTDTIQKMTDETKRFDFFHALAVFDRKLNVVASTEKNIGKFGDDLPEYKKLREDVLTGKQLNVYIEREHEGHRLLMHVEPLKQVKNGKSEIVGLLEYHVLVSSYTDKINALIFRMMGIGLTFTIVLVLVLATILRREVVEPITRYSRIAQKVSEGDFNQKIENLSDDEIGHFGGVFNSMLANLREMDSIKSGFNSVVAHQLRTPLSGVKWALKLLLDGDVGPLTSEQRGMLLHGYETNDKMVRLINDLLSVSRIEDGKVGATFEENDFNKLLNEIVTNSSVACYERNIELSVNNRAPSIPPFFFDYTSISIAIQNILDNAIKYTLPGGKVMVSVNKVGKYLEIKISDTGVGIPKEDMPKLFSKFFRASNVVYLQTEGTGLGMFIVKSIILRHGGKIWVESEPTKGTTVGMTLPLEKELLPKQGLGEIVSGQEY
ncbi:MAG: HAMP domain-containing sensor histidine kinase [Patescibacteria group bacterium]